MLAGCTGESYDSLHGESYSFVDQHGEEITFPDDYEGEILVVGYVYTKCPDICSIITANMRNIYDAMEDREQPVRFVSVTFDPKRDTPEQLQSYARTFGLDERNWTLLTGDVAEVDRFMERMGVRRALAGEEQDTFDLAAAGEDYIIDHSDRMTLLDGQANVREIYMGSRMPADMVIEDIERLLEER